MLAMLFIMPQLEAQENEFKKLMNLFTKDNTVIPYTLAAKYFDFRPTETKRKLVADAVILRTDTFMVLSTHFECPERVFCNQSILTSFSNTGEKMDHIVFEQNIADCSFDDQRIIVFVSKKMLVFKEIRKKLDCLGDGEELTINRWAEFQPITTDGTFGKAIRKKEGLYREYFKYSYKVAKLSELSRKTEEELGVIKNEIYASHGYIFKTALWKKYFIDKAWYQPLKEDVSEELSEVEKKNIELILSIQK